MPSDTPASNPLQRGYYVPFSGDAAEFHGWVTLMSSIMYESDLGNVMHGDETAPAALEEDASSAATTAYRKALHKFKEGIERQSLHEAAADHVGLPGGILQPSVAGSPITWAHWGREAR